MRRPMLMSLTCRFIPAGAGNTLTPLQGTGSWCGSSPQARGTPRISRLDDMATDGRFIPAGAGNTLSAGASAPRSVHPRRRGEHFIAPRVSTRCRSHGSSPQARGTLHREPASHLRRPVHPRRRGEHRGGRHTESVTVHPRRRGEHIRSQIGHDRRLRFIPAGAGNTQIAGSCALIWISVHPRRRGEHARRRICRCQYPGSSPQARGTHSAASLIT